MYERDKRKNLRKNEIFFNTYKILYQCNFSSNLHFFNFKRNHNASYFSNLRNFCVFSLKRRSIISKLKTSRLAFNRKQNEGFFCGLYKVNW